ncbi:MAG: hypothetical protein V7608_6516, partial [Hyphomicrobiales bacterium]
KTVTFVNTAAVDALDKPTQDAILKAAAVAEERGWKLAAQGVMLLMAVPWSPQGF